MATADMETPVTHFANPYLQCLACGKRAVGIVGAMTQVVNLLNGLISITIPATARNWPCYDIADRQSVCDSWSTTTGCPHTMQVRAEHSASFVFEGLRK